MQAPMQIDALGTLTITVGGRRIEALLSRKAGALLVYLALTAQLHTREHLATLFWSDKSAERAYGSLRMATLELRRQIAPYLETSRQSVGLIPASYALDAQTLATAVEAARQSGATGLETDAAANIAQALDRYRGDLLRDFYGGSPEFEQWLTIERERLRALFCEGTRTLVDTYRRAQRWTEGVDIVRRALAVDPLHESLNRQLMALLAGSGEHRAALEHYHAFAQRLADELELTPEAETLTFYDRLRAGLPEDTSPPTSSKPLDSTPLIGRQAALDEMIARFAEADCHLLTLIGPGGIGKTRLALAAVEFYRRSTAFPDGCLFVPLAALNSPQRIIPAVVQAVGFTPPRDGRTLEQQLLDFFRHKQALLIFDNYEHLIDGANVAAKFSLLPNVKVLVTSREPLDVAHEQLLILDGLAYPASGSPSPDYAAAQLFVRAVRRVYPDYTPGDRDRQAIAVIARLVDGSPLGLLLAAAWIDVLTPQDIADELQHSIDFLQNSVPEIPPRQQSIRAVFAATWQRLDEGLRAIFRQLAVIRGGCSRDAVQAISGASLREIQLLVNKSLLMRDPTGRFHIHELLRQYAEEQLRLTGGYDPARNAHSQYYLHYLSASGVKGERQLEALLSVDAEFDNIRDAWLWGVERGAVDQLAASLDDLYWYCDLRELRRDRLTLLQAALDAGRRQSLDERWQGRLLARCWESGAQARAQLRTALAIASRHDDSAEIAQCLYQRGLAAELDRRSNAACRHFRRAFDRYQALNDEYFCGVVSVAWALSALHAARVDETEALTRQWLPRLRRNGDVIHLALLLRCRGSSLGVVGENEAADRCHEEARELLLRQNNHLLAADTGAWDMGISVLRAGDFKLARQRANHLLELAEEYGYQIGRGRAYCVLSAVTLVEGDYEASYEFARQAEHLLAGHVNLVYAQSYAATAAAAIGDFRGARARVKRVLPEAVRVNEQVVMCLILPVSAVILAHDNQPKRAAECITLALHHRASMGKWAEGVLKQFQLLSARSGDPAQASTPEDIPLIDPALLVDYFTPLKKIVSYRSDEHDAIDDRLSDA